MQVLLNSRIYYLEVHNAMLS